MNRIDIYPTHRHGTYQLRPGRPYPLGATAVPGGVNFAVISSVARTCTLVLFDKGQPSPKAEIPFPPGFRIGDVFTMIVFDLDMESLEYGFRVDGPFEPAAGLRCDPSKILLDPYARAIGGRDVWGAPPDFQNVYPYRARLVPDDFDWEGDRPLEIPFTDLVIYEMHVRGFTRDASSGVKFPGTYAGLREKIPYLQELGVNCVELLPVFEFDEFEHSRKSPVTGELLMNYWGYSTLGFFAPKAGYAATGRLGMQVDEFKALVKDLHQHGIEIILDVVFNHTAEGDERGPTIHFRGLDNKTYYLLTADGHYYNFSGTGNTLNCNHPVVRMMVLDCLRYWASEFHIDGFRFDLASILGRDIWGAPLANPPLLEALAHDPILAKCKLIAEAWDAGGLYQVGSFPSYGRWAEWNGRYRDTVRRFLKGDLGVVGDMAERLAGSSDLYYGRGTTASINFITCHDGFNLADLVSYNDKHNEANGEENRDGANDNHSWNCGAEGPTDDPGVNALRRRQMKNALAMLLVSQGVPMLLMGDEVGRTQQGNNNVYCQDNGLNWLDWSLREKNADLFRFTQRLIAFRQAHRVLRRATHFNAQSAGPHGLPEISWHGTRAWDADWSGTGRTLAFMLTGSHEPTQYEDNSIYVILNMHWDTHGFALPEPPHGQRWHVFVNTDMPSPQDVWEPGNEPLLEEQAFVLAAGRSVVILVGKRTAP